jgi:RNA-directed DNA polymerase
MLKFLEYLIADRRLLRLIRTWLTPGVIEDGEWPETVQGTLQGASVTALERLLALNARPVGRPLASA